MRNIDNQPSGFTSTQLLIVVVIIGIVVAVVLASGLLGQAGKADQAQAAEEIETIGIALDTYAKDNGDYPQVSKGWRRCGRSLSSRQFPSIGWVHI